MPPPSSSSPRPKPPKMAPQRAQVEIIMIAPAIVAAIELIRMSRLMDVRKLMPDDALEFVAVADAHDSARHRDRRMIGIAPVAKALGVSVSIR